MEPIVPPQTDKRKHHIILVVLAVVAGSLYIAFNIWVYRYAKSGKTPSPAAIFQNPGGFPSAPVPTKPTLTPPAKQDLAPPDTPSPRPTGPGPFACAPDGTCNRYGEEIRQQFCPVTFVDTQCLDQCGDTGKRCSK